MGAELEQDAISGGVRFNWNFQPTSPEGTHPTVGLEGASIVKVNVASHRGDLSAVQLIRRGGIAFLHNLGRIKDADGLFFKSTRTYQFMTGV